MIINLLKKKNERIAFAWYVVLLKLRSNDSIFLNEASADGIIKATLFPFIRISQQARQAWKSHIVKWNHFLQTKRFERLLLELFMTNIRVRKRRSSLIWRHGATWTRCMGILRGAAGILILIRSIRSMTCYSSRSFGRIIVMIFYFIITWVCSISKLSSRLEAALDGLEKASSASQHSTAEKKF